MKHGFAHTAAFHLALSIVGCGGNDPGTASATASGSARAAAPGSASQRASSSTAKPTATTAAPSASASAAEAPASATASAEAPPPPPYDGKLTIAMVMGALHVAKPFDEWDDAMKRLNEKVGPPTRVKGDQYCWAVAEGDQCAEMCIDKTTSKKLNRDGKDRPMVGATDNPQTIGKEMDIALEHCRQKTKDYKPPPKK